MGRILDTWKNRAEQESKAQAYDEEMIREAKRSEVEEEIRRQVDMLMREELDLLKIVSNPFRSIICFISTVKIQSYYEHQNILH